MDLPKPGKIVIISSPSGGGKSSICRKLLSPARRKKGWTFSVSFTTRKARIGERNGREYYFVGEEKFMELARRDFFAEHFKVHLYRYGTPRAPLERIREKGGVVILDVDVQGAFRLRKEYPDAITIFVLPPSVTELRRRLKKRGTETREQLLVRFENAKKEIALFEKFDYVVINKELNVAVKEVLSIIRAHNCRIDYINKKQIKKKIGY
ncbi:MAG: guanylate kinase [candidate division Zixibacteria bacterium]|nr:guanylate kinase [candidate division Zixibacteria bacterium]